MFFSAKLNIQAEELLWWKVSELHVFVHKTSVQHCWFSIHACSEVRLNEALENACSNVLDYKVHKDKVKALRYEKSKYAQPVKAIYKGVQQAPLEHKWF